MKTLSYVLLCLAAFCGCSNAMAMTYYVDAKNGNDSLSGTSASVSATNGPWQSMVKVNSAPLQPGDQVLFSCGQTWYETLKPTGNGTAAAKIVFGSYPSQCADKPKISGFRSISSNNWQRHQGNIWKTSFPQNLITNSSLSSSVANWVKWPADASQTFNATCPLSVASCMNFLAGNSTNSSLAISNSFPITGGKKYAATISFYAASDTSANLIVRENGNAYRTLGLNKKITGNNQWQNINVEFTATHTLTNARLDIEAPKAKRLYIRNVQMQESGTLPRPSTVLFDNDPVTIAHHPNAGHDISTPESVYLRTTAASPTFIDLNNRSVSSQIMVPNLKLPVSGNVGPGTKIRLREVNWRINDYSVNSVSSGALSISPNTIYPVTSAGWGFYFYDALWMLDSAGEWFFDEATQSMYLWTPTNENPGKRVSLATLGTGINLNSKSNMMIENLEIDGALTGVSMEKSTNVSLQSLNIHNINGNAVFARQSANPTISGNHINRVGVSGVSAVNAYDSTDAFIENNELTEAGVIVNAGKRISLPMTTEYAISGGIRSIIANNVLSDIGGLAILSESDNKIEANIIERACFNINDCSAIYASPKSLRTTIRNNLILEIPGDITGVPDLMGKISNGIYLDDGISGLSVTGNTVKGGTSSIHLHNSGQNTITGNILYGAENRLIWQQEDSLANGGIFGNIITNNQFFSTINGVAIHNQFLSADASKFATYDNNHYSTVYSPHITREFDALGLSTAYTLNEWQTATTTAGTPRNNDLSSNAPAPLTSFAQGVNGDNLMNNSDFSTGLIGWSSWNAVAPKSNQTLEGCLPVSVNCMHVIAGASETLVNSPKFTVTKGKLYRVVFDIKTSEGNSNLTSLIRFAGPVNYKGLMMAPYKFSTSNSWQRHSFIFEATATASSTTINDQGARFDIQGLPAPQSLWIANLEITPFDPGILGPTRSDLLINKTEVDKTIDCPTRLSDSGLCSHYFIFPEATAAIWPMSVPPRSGRIVFTQNITLLDADGDGIADSQDNCPGTVDGLAVNGRGCSLVD